MPSCMRGEMAIDFCQIRHLFEIGIHALVGDDRQHHASQHYFRVITVFLNQSARHIKQRNNTQFTRFLSVLTYPHIAVGIGGYVGAFE